MLSRTLCLLGLHRWEPDNRWRYFVVRRCRTCDRLEAKTFGGRYVRREWLEGK